MDLKDRVLLARKTKGLSQEDLAELVGVSRQAVSKWETGEAMPDMEKLIALCHALELDMEYLALGKEPAPSVREVKKFHKWIAVVLAAVCLGVGVLIGYLLPKNAEPSQLDTIEISQVTVTPVEGMPIGPMPLKLLFIQTGCRKDWQWQSCMERLTNPTQKFAGGKKTAIGSH